MSEQPSHSEYHPHRERQYLEDDPVFEVAKERQKSLDSEIFNTYSQASARAVGFVDQLDRMAKEGNLLHEFASLFGPQVYTPRPYYDEDTGAILFKPQKPFESNDDIPNVSGEFCGFFGYAAADAARADTYRPLLGVQVILRHIQAPNFYGKVTAYGPITSTSVSFMEDALKKASFDNLI